MNREDRRHLGFGWQRPPLEVRAAIEEDPRLEFRGLGKLSAGKARPKDVLHGCSPEGLVRWKLRFKFGQRTSQSQSVAHWEPLALAIRGFEEAEVPVPIPIVIID